MARVFADKSSPITTVIPPRDVRRATMDEVCDELVKVLARGGVGEPPVRVDRGVGREKSSRPPDQGSAPRGLEDG